ncbi:MAG: hypothetical protein RLZ12_1042 [Bacillota bacterium]|jgi:hypothetical protein
MKLANLQGHVPLVKGTNERVLPNSTINAITTDKNGYIYVTGTTSKNCFNLKNACQTTLSGKKTIFVCKIDPLKEGDEALLYATYLGGDGDDEALDIAVDNKQNVYLTGITTSSNFPIRNAFQNKPLASASAFVTKLCTLKPDSLAYSSYLGGENFTAGHGITVDNTGTAYLTGATRATNLPVTALQDFLPTNLTAFICRVANTPQEQSVLSYCNYLGGEGHDSGCNIAVDDNGYVYVSGFTNSSKFPTTNNALQNKLQGKFNTFISKFNFNTDQPQLAYGTYAGGSGRDIARALTVDKEQNVYLTGQTNSSDFLNKPSKSKNTGNNDAFVLKLVTTSNAMPNDPNNFFAYLGGSKADVGHSIALDKDGLIYISGATSSTDFPLHNTSSPPQQNPTAFLCQIDPFKNKLLYSSYLDQDLIEGKNMVFCDNEHIYLSGKTTPTSSTILQIRTLQKERSETIATVDTVSSPSNKISTDQQHQQYKEQASPAAPSKQIDPGQAPSAKEPIMIEKPKDFIALSDHMNGMNVDYPLPQINTIDNREIRLICNPPRGTFFAMGITNVNCIAEDNEGNKAYTYFDVIVRPKTNE